MFATGHTIPSDEAAGASGTPLALDEWSKTAYPYQVIGFILVWLAIVSAMVVAG